jgi:hypothetical protein
VALFEVCRVILCERIMPPLLPSWPCLIQLCVFVSAGAPGGAQGTVSQDEAAQQEFLSRVLFMIGTFIALCLIFFP